MSTSNTSKRPRLSLQTSTAATGRTRSKSTLGLHTDIKSPTAFNTLSNVYVTAIERSTPVQSTPVTAINLLQTLRIQTNPEVLKDLQRTQTPYTATYPDTPLSANPKSPMQIEIQFPSTMTATPPLSAGPVESTAPRVFSFGPTDIAGQAGPTSPAQSRRKMLNVPAAKLPYTHPRSLHSILRNSPLPHAGDKSPISPRRQSLRLQEKAARRVGYESPLTQTIITEKYTKSHVDLLSEDASPYSATPTAEDSEMVLDHTMAYTGDETRDGGQTPGPFEEMRRRMAGLGSDNAAGSPRPGGIRKKRKEKKRRWVWTIGQDAEEEDSEASVSLRAAAAAEASTPRVVVPMLSMVQSSVEAAEPRAHDANVDVEMSDASSVLSSSRATTPLNGDLDARTPTLAALNTHLVKASHLGSAVLFNSETGSRRDTPVPPDLVASN
ncbi:hypothetical protein PFICI_08715 [Pestalotiopsis fici W106-1]|uniref:Uncharacterized protein n=1 Tax=Pestalotiopsis fici (strain W106-1 / CGMCC3.15140) TaxID=1229662 RepID=W3X0H3_PESFW|nr:uncharacterized protein PFICI_08715 [Pestalotiopsis fici W106-1]ETS78862.1 hypothetical protein PFICI_08715 [Pestalotiopsis fici W106-1]